MICSSNVCRASYLDLMNLYTPLVWDSMTGSFTCPCTKVSFSNHKIHCTSSKHQKYIQHQQRLFKLQAQHPQERIVDNQLRLEYCYICMTDQPHATFVTCYQCNDRHCLKCNKQLLKPICPQCRINNIQFRRQLFTYVKEDNIDKVEEIFKKYHFDPNTIVDNMWTLLTRAMSPSMILFLVEQGCDLNMKTSDGYNPLTWHIHQQHVDIVICLVLLGAKALE